MSPSIEGGAESPAGPRRWERSAALVVAVLASAACLGLLFAQVEVADSGVGATRSCGSAFDAAVDRSGWELWWARDLDEPDPGERAALIRTTRCPEAVNLRIGAAAALGAFGSFAALASRRSFRSERAEPGRVTSTAGAITRLGRATSVAGAVLSIAGVVALVVLVADADSTLFLYTDRLVVAVVGLIVLIPALALFAIGRVVQLVGAHLERTAREDDDA